MGFFLESTKKIAGNGKKNQKTSRFQVKAHTGGEKKIKRKYQLIT